MAGLKWSKGKKEAESYCKCCCPGCASTRRDKNIKWHKVPKTPTFLKHKRLKQVERYHLRKKNAFVLLDKLGKKLSNLEVHRWCRKHDSDKPFKSNVTYDHNNKKNNVSFEIYLIPDTAGIKNACSKVS